MPKSLVWDADLIRRFWDGVSDMPVLDKLSFSRLSGPGVIELVRPYLDKPGIVCLDFGGGDGHLADLLLDAGCEVASYEPSVRRAERINERLAGKPGFRGTVGPNSGMVFDAVFCLEVVEHVLPAEMHGFLAQLSNLVKPGGLLFVSCPFEEDLEASFVYCPTCDSEFHRWQHLRSLTASGVRTLVESGGFETVWQGVVAFGDVDILRDYHSEKASWVDHFIDETGKALPMIGPGGQNFIVGRRPENATTPVARERVEAAISNQRPPSANKQRTIEGIERLLAEREISMSEARRRVAKRENRVARREELVSERAAKLRSEAAQQQAEAAERHARLSQHQAEVAQERSELEVERSELARSFAAYDGLRIVRWQRAIKAWKKRFFGQTGQA